MTQPSSSPSGPAAAPAARLAANGAGALVPPQGFYAAVAVRDKNPRPCKDIPKPHTESLEFPSKYEGSDSARDDFNPKSYAKYKEKSERVNLVEKEFSAAVETYLRDGREENLQCALGLMNQWAKAGALESRVTDHTGRSVRKWALGSYASSYVRLKFSSSQPLRAHGEEAARIEAWLDRLTRIVIEDWSDQPIDKFNNHEYWAAWAVMASSVALNRRDYFDWALTQYRRAASQVDADGYLPNELKRDTRALAYHNYSLGPLAMIAAFARANGSDMLPEGNQALKRLADRVLQGLANPEVFASKTGHRQNLEDIKESSKFAWMEPYCAMTRCDDGALSRLQELRPMKTYRLGGNVTELFAPRSAAASARGTASKAPDAAAALALEPPLSPDHNAYAVNADSGAAVRSNPAPQPSQHTRLNRR